MDILAGIEAASASNNLKQYMATVNQLARASGLTSSADLTVSSTLGTALQALINPLGNVSPLLPVGQSVPTISSPLNPLLVAAAAALSEQHVKSMFSSSTPLALSLPSVATFNAFPHALHSQIVGCERDEGEGSAEHSANEQQKEEQNVPTLVSLLASASVGTPPQRKRNIQQRERGGTAVERAEKNPQQTPAAKRPKICGQAAEEMETFCDHPTSLFGSSTTSEFHGFQSTAVGSSSANDVPSTASLLSALNAASTKFPLAAASPPALPSPPCAQNSMASSGVRQSQKSAHNSPTHGNTLVRRLSSLSGSSSTSGSITVGGETATAFNGMAIILPRTPQRKPAAPVPPEKKDSAYKERRLKNNAAAKRSRDTRRLKEELTAQRAAFLEQENIQLKKQVAMLKADLTKNRAILLSVGLPAPNGPSSALPINTPTPSHVLASPTSTTTTNGECHPTTRKGMVFKAEEDGGTQ